MKRIISLLLACVLIALMAGCDSDSDKAAGPSNYTPDYYDAETFESDLNAGVKVNGKIVQFYVNDYKPDSILGINTWAGEHLNFLSEEELDVEKGDYVIGRVTSEPTKTLLGGSWKIPYEVLEIRDEPIKNTGANAEAGQENETTAATQESKAPETTPPETTVPETTVPENTTIVMTADATYYVGKKAQDVESELKGLGFVNVKLIESITTDVSKTDGTVECVKADSSEFKKGDAVEKDAEITIVFVKVEQPKLEIVFPKEGSKLAKDFDSKGNTTVYYINVDGQKNKPTLKKWGKATVTDGVAEYLDYLESLGFTVTIVNTSQKEPYSGFTVYETDFKVSKADFSWTMYLCIQDQDFVEYELDIHLD